MKSGGQAQILGAMAPYAHRGNATGAGVLLVVVTVSAAEGVRGLLLQGRRQSTSVVVGRFVHVDQAGAKTIYCDGPDDTLVAWYGAPTDGAGDAGFSSRSYTWMPPDDNADRQLQLVYVQFSV